MVEMDTTPGMKYYAYLSEIHIFLVQTGVIYITFQKFNTVQTNILPSITQLKLNPFINMCMRDFQISVGYIVPYQVLRPEMTFKT